MASKLKFIDEVPSNRTGRRGYFTEEIREQLIANEGKWALVEASAPAAKKFTGEPGNADFKYKTRTTDKTYTTRTGSDAKVVEVYVSYKPKK